jgi:hypothetical protein
MRKQQSGIHASLRSWRSWDRFTGGLDTFSLCRNQFTHFLGNANIMFGPKNKKHLENIMIAIQHQWESNPRPLDHSPAGDTSAIPVCCLLFASEILLFIETTDYRSNFAKTILFEIFSCFWKKRFSISVESPRIFQCLISMPAGHWVRHIDGDLPRRFFLSALLSLGISMTGRSERSARALRDGADVVREAIGN